MVPYRPRGKRRIMADKGKSIVW